MLVTTVLNAAQAAMADPRHPVRTFEELDSYAQQVATEDFNSCPPLPEPISALDYDLYRMIAFRPEKAVWWGVDPFWFELFHRGFVHRNRVAIHVVSGTKEIPIPFSQEYFNYRGPLKQIRLPDDTGFAGLKIVGRFPGRDDGQEMLALQGASYFRARTADTVYGTSARGLAINCGTRGAEEFPVFRQFWVRKPTSTATTLTLLALLESESVTGAYQFTLQPGRHQTAIEVRARLYFRKQVEKVGIAPLTSMWMWGDGLSPPAHETRPHVHDADGLLIAEADDRWTWRALSRQSYPSLTRLECNDLRGFGLMQRETRYQQYQDDEALYHRRPSVWIEPAAEWGPGAIELLELNGAHEGIDNIAAFWVPRGPMPVGSPVELRYTVRVFRGELPEHRTLAKCVETSIDRRGETLEFRVTFRGPALRKSTPQSPPALQVAAVRGTVENQRLEPAADGGWQARVAVRRENPDPASTEPVEIRMTLHNAAGAISETWCYLCAPQPPPYASTPNAGE